jgi:hypothetical protein
VAQSVEALGYRFDSDGVMGIFYLLSPPGRTVALGSSQRLTAMTTREAQAVGA